jgi:chlorobactene glucosyltransferase
MSVVPALLWTLPWVVPPIVAFVRGRHSRSLDEFPPEVAAGSPLVSIIIPARDERRNIERCVRSVQGTRFPAVEVIVVDDISRDGTAAAARAAAAGDERLTVLEAPELPAGWFGKQWACATGARAARGELLLFTDADTWHAPDLLPRAVNALHARGADLLSVGGRQEMHTFWERVVQPQLFALLLIRYGGTEHVSHAKRPVDVIANGQFILVCRQAYDASGGHERVRDRAAEDLAMAQEYVRDGRRIALLFGDRQLSTRMYASLRELIAGWRKNIYAGGRTASLGGSVGRALYPIFLLGIPLFGLFPVAALVLAASKLLSAAWLAWSAVVVAFTLLAWMVVYRLMRESPVYALAYPLGLVVLLVIALGAVARGQRVEWKARSYVAR